MPQTEITTHGVKGIAPEACPEVFEPSVLGTLFRHRFASDVTAGQVVEELAIIRQTARRSGSCESGAP